MRRPEGCPYPVYKMAMRKLNDRLDKIMAGQLMYAGPLPYVALRMKPLAIAVRNALA